MLRDPRFWAVVLLVCVPIAVLVFAFWRYHLKIRARTAFLNHATTLFSQLDAKQIDEGVFALGDAVYSIDANPSPLFSSKLSLRLSRYCDSLYEFTPKDVTEDAPKELITYLNTVQPSLEGAYPNRWASFSKQHIEVVLAGNLFHHADYSATDLKSDLATLDVAATTPLRLENWKGVVTIRTGFEKGIPAWHWTPEQIDAFPEDVSRVVFSYYSGNPLLNPPIAELILKLAGDKNVSWITEETEFDMLEHAFGKRFSFSNGVFKSTHPELLAAADQYYDGTFFRGALAGLTSDFGEHPRHELHNRATKLIGEALFYCRRLYDDEHSWFNGEYELISTTLSEHALASAVAEMAETYQAKMLQLDMRFHRRMLQEDRMAAMLEEGTIRAT